MGDNSKKLVEEKQEFDKNGLEKAPKWQPKVKIKPWLVLLIIVLVIGFFVFLAWQSSNKEKGEVYGVTTADAEELILVNSTKTRFLEPWKNVIDGDVDGFFGTTLARVVLRNRPYAVFEFKDDKPRKISRIRIMTDTGLRKRERYFLESFSLYVANKSGNYERVLDDAIKNGGGWQTYNFPEVEARLIKLILNKPINKNWIQIGEFEVYTQSELGLDD